MSDLRLRRLERKARQGDPDAAAHEILMRVRTGMTPRQHVVYAAHLGDYVALKIEPNPQVVISCPNCRARREERDRRNRNPRPRPVSLRESPRDCLRCKGSERVPLSKGIVKLVQMVEDIPHRLLVAWAADCVERQIEHLVPMNPHAFYGRYRMPGQELRDPTLRATILPLIREWVDTNEIDPLLYQTAMVNAAAHRTLDPATALATMVALAGVEEQSAKVRFRAASLASTAYHASGGSREERNWQERRLIQYLLGYLG